MMKYLSAYGAKGIDKNVNDKKNSRNLYEYSSNPLVNFVLYNMRTGRINGMDICKSTPVGLENSWSSPILYLMLSL